MHPLPVCQAVLTTRQHLHWWLHVVHDVQPVPHWVRCDGGAPMSGRHLDGVV